MLITEEEKNWKIYSPLYFQKVILHGGLLNYEKAKNCRIFPSFSGKVGYAQFQKCPVSSHYGPL